MNGRISNCKGYKAKKEEVKAKRERRYTVRNLISPLSVNASTQLMGRVDLVTLSLLFCPYACAHMPAIPDDQPYRLCIKASMLDFLHVLLKYTQLTYLLILRP